jgi:hypothetical protein
MLLKPPNSLCSSLQLQVLGYVKTLIVKQQSFNDYRLIKLSNNVKRKRAKHLIIRSERNPQEVAGLIAAVPFITAVQGDNCELLAQVNQVLSDHYYISGKLLLKLTEGQKRKYLHTVAPHQENIGREEGQTEMIRSGEVMQSREEEGGTIVAVSSMYDSYDYSGVLSVVEESEEDQSVAEHEYLDDVIQHDNTPPNSSSSSLSLSNCYNKNNFSRRSVLHSCEVPSIVKPVVLRSGARKSLSERGCTFFSVPVQASAL